MARQTLVGCLPGLVAIDTEAHLQVDIPLRDSLVADRSVAGCALDLRANMWRVIESDVRLARVAEDPLPRNVDAPLRIVRHRLDQRPVSGDRLVANHARLHARQTRNRSLVRAFMTVVRALELFLDVCSVWKR